MKYLLYSIAALIACTGSSMAQTFQSQAALGRADKTGFYVIPVTQSLAARCKTDFADIRIADDKGVWIPHILQAVPPRPAADGFLSLPMQAVPVSGTAFTQLRISNNSGRLINNLVLRLKNADVDRVASLSGSYDGSNWFIIHENLRLQAAETTTGSEQEQQLHFSPSDYTFFRVKINNRKTDPLLVTAAGTVATVPARTESDIQWNQPCTYKQEEQANGITRLTVTAPLTANINGIAVAVASPQLYQRDATLWIINPADTTARQQVPADRLLLKSGEPLVNTATIKAREFYLTIENRDNPPLRIREVRTFMHRQYIITWLEAGRSYFVLAGNHTATAAVYDLEKFRSELQPVADTLHIGVFEDRATAHTTPVKTGGHSGWLWPMIAVGLAGLGLLTWRLLADMKKRGM